MREHRIAKRRADGERALDAPVDAVMLARVGQRAADQRSARNALDPGDLARRTALPAKQGRHALRSARRRRRSASHGLRLWLRPRSLAFLSEMLDPGEHFADRGDRCRWAGRRLRRCGNGLRFGLCLYCGRRLRLGLTFRRELLHSHWLRRRLWSRFRSRFGDRLDARTGRCGGCRGAPGRQVGIERADESGLSGLAVASTSFHCDGCKDAEARIGADTATVSTANTMTRGSGRLGCATARAAAARSCWSIRSASDRTSVSACCDSGVERSGARASSSTSWRQRTARSCGLAAGCANTVCRRSSNRTANSASFKTGRNTVLVVRGPTEGADA